MRPSLILSRGNRNVVKYNDQYYVVPQRYGTLHLDIVQDRCRPNIICVGTLNEALAHLGDKVTIPVIFVVGADKGGTGKEQPLTSQILTPTGWKLMGDMKVGMPICGIDGKIYRVKGVFPQGVKPAYRMTFTDGTSAECGAQHLWKTRHITNGAREGWIVRTTEQLLKFSLRANDCFYYRIPHTEPAQFASSSVPLDPYLLGVLIGDGYLTGGTCAFSVPPLKEGIKQKIAEALEPSYELTGPHSSIASPQWSIVGGERAKTTMRARIRSLGLSCKSKQRFIPDVYKTASISDRLELLRGLMDTDGTTKNGRTSFSTCSPQLAVDVADLVRSLGGVAISRSYHSNKNKPREWSINVRMRVCPFSLDYKAASWRPAAQLFGKHIKSIEYIGDVPQQCISTSAPDKMYITDGYNATHNTTLCRVLLDWLDEHLPPGSSLRTFDTQLPLGNLKRFRSNIEVVNINEVEDQMKVFDNVEDARATVVDVCAGNLFSILETLDKAGLLKDIASGAVRMVVMHVVGPNIASMEEIGEVMVRIGGGAVRPILIKNHYTKTKFKVAEDPRYAEALRLAAPGTINVPQLASEAMEEIEMQGVGFAQFIKGLDINNQPLSKRNSRMLVGYTAQWLQAVWAEFDRVNIANVFS